jgi:ribonuclease HI
MTKPTDYELLRLIYKHLNMPRLLAENPSLTKADVDGIFQRLSSHVRSQTAPGEKFTIHVDGGSRGNPGPGGIGVVILGSDGQVVEEITESIGRCTSNEAEYQALLRGIRRAKDLGARDLTIKSDSELLVKQLNGVYRIKSPNLLPLCREVMALLRQFAKWKALHIPREENTRADMLANLGIDQQDAQKPKHET